MKNIENFTACPFCGDKGIVQYQTEGNEGSVPAGYCCDAMDYYATRRDITFDDAVQISLFCFDWKAYEARRPQVNYRSEPVPF